MRATDRNLTILRVGISTLLLYDMPPTAQSNSPAAQILAQSFKLPIAEQTLLRALIGQQAEQIEHKAVKMLAAMDDAALENAAVELEMTLPELRETIVELRKIYSV